MVQDLPWRSLFSHLPTDPDSLTDPDSDEALPARPLPTPVAVGAVALGGVVGSLARAWASTALPHQASAWPWATLLVNISGSGLLALVLVALAERFPRSRLARPLLGTGVLGGYTTFSTFSLDFVQLASHGRPVVAFAYVVASVAGATAAAVVGLSLARAADRLSDPGRWRRRAVTRPDSEPGP